MPVESLSIERTVLRPGTIELHLRNTSPQDLRIAQVVINDAFWPYEAAPGSTLPRLGSAVITLHYPWVEGEAYNITLLTSSSVRFETSIAAATATARPTGARC